MQGERFSVVWFTPFGAESLRPTEHEVAAAVAKALADATQADAEEAAQPAVSSETDVTAAAGGVPAEALDPAWSVELQQGCSESHPNLRLPRMGLGTFRLKVTAPAKLPPDIPRGACCSMFLP